MIQTRNLPIILASSSPRRRELMESLGLHFTVRPSHVEEETDPDAAPAEMVKDLALRKARQVALAEPDHLVIGSDTIVVIDGRVLGKPADEEEAAAMLSLLSGRVHTVYTGLALIHHAAGMERVEASSTQVRMRRLPETEIKAYVATGEPADKAGAYAIQGLGATLVEGIDGDYFTVVGLPVGRLAIMLRDFGIDVLRAER